MDDEEAKRVMRLLCGRRRSIAGGYAFVWTRAYFIGLAAGPPPDARDVPLRELRAAPLSPRRAIWRRGEGGYAGPGMLPGVRCGQLSSGMVFNGALRRRAQRQRTLREERVSYFCERPNPGRRWSERACVWACELHHSGVAWNAAPRVLTRGTCPCIPVRP